MLPKSRTTSKIGIPFRSQAHAAGREMREERDAARQFRAEPTWKSCPDLMDRLRAAQNHPANRGQDIVTWSGMCSSRDELLAHVMRNELALERGL